MALNPLRLATAVATLTLLFYPAHALDSCVIPHGQTYTVNEHSTCKRVTNSHSSGSSVMVPTKTSAEWSSGANAFANAPPPGVTLANCGGGGPAPMAEIANIALDSAINAIFEHGPYIYVKTINSLYALTFNGSAFSIAGSIALSGSGITSMCHNGSYIFVPRVAGGVSALSFNGSTFSLLATHQFTGGTSPSTGSVACHDGYVFTSVGKTGLGTAVEGIYVASFNGSSFSQTAFWDAESDNPRKISFDAANNRFILGHGGAGTKLFRYNGGGSITYIAGLSSPVRTTKTAFGGGYFYGVDSGGSYPLRAFTGTATTLTDNGNDGSIQRTAVATDGTQIFISRGATYGITAYTFNGSAFTTVSSLPASPYASGELYANANYLFAGGGNGTLYAISKSGSVGASCSP